MIVQVFASIHIWGLNCITILSYIPVSLSFVERIDVLYIEYNVFVAYPLFGDLPSQCGGPL